MTDDEKQPKNVRRVGKKDRKQKLESAGPLFPPDSMKATPLQPPDAPSDESALPDDIALLGEAAALFVDSSLATGEFAPGPKEMPAPVEESMPTPEETAPEPEETLAVPELPVTEAAVAPPKAAKRRTQEAALPWRDDGHDPVRAPKPAPQPVRKSRWPFTRHDLVALLFLIASGGVIAFGVTLVRDPYSAINPLPPHIPPPIIVTATFVPTPTPTYTPSPTTRPTATFTPLPAALLTSIAPTRESTQEATAETTASP